MGDKTRFEVAGQFRGYQWSDRGLLDSIQLESTETLWTIRLSKACQVSLWELALHQDIRLGDWVLVKGTQSLKKQGMVYKAAEISPLVSAMESALSASEIDSLSPTVVVPSPNCSSKPTQILVCQKSSCRKRGSQAVQRCLAQTLQDCGLTEQAKIKETGCLKECGKGPAIAIGKKRYTKLSQADIPALVAVHFPAMNLPMGQPSLDTEAIVFREPGVSITDDCDRSICESALSRAS
jgi:(2Fe-2S) ferredoxin